MANKPKGRTSGSAQGQLRQSKCGGWNLGTHVLPVLRHPLTARFLSLEAPVTRVVSRSSLYPAFSAAAGTMSASLLTPTPLCFSAHSLCFCFGLCLLCLGTQRSQRPLPLQENICPRHRQYLSVCSAHCVPVVCSDTAFCPSLCEDSLREHCRCTK